MERRNFTRYPVRFRSSFSSAEMVAGEGVVLDLSLRGCRISGATRVPLGTELQLRLMLPEYDQQSPVEVEQAVVQWIHEANEFGVEFVQLGTGVPERISRFVRTCETAPEP